MATDTLGDPNAVITDPTGGAPNFNIKDVFNSFGYYPSQAEISALAPSFEGRYDVGRIGTSAIAQYVNQKKAEADRQKNDPLAALQTRVQDSIALMKNQITGLQTQLSDTLSAAPQLFGSLTPDQIQEYLGPLQDSFKTQLATVQSTIAGRGLAASSTENNALAQTDEQFKNQVFSTGLSVGLDAQKNKASSIQAQINNLFGLTGQEEGINAAAAGQRSSQDLGQSNLIASLPSFLNAQSAMESQIAKKNASGGGFQGMFNQVTGDISQGANALQSLFMIPQQFKTAAPAAQPGVNAPNLPPGGIPGAADTSALSQDALFAAA